MSHEELAWQNAVPPPPAANNCGDHHYITVVDFVVSSRSRIVTMIIVEQDNEKAIAGAGNAYSGGVQTTQLIYASARMPEPDISNLSNRIGVMRMSEQDAPPAYDLVTGPLPQAPSSSSTQRYSPEEIVASGSGARTFEPLVLHSRGKRLQEGFYLMLPPTDIVPHPLLQRAVTTEDWKKFLNELQETAKLSNNTPGSASGEPSSPSPLREAATKFLTSFKANHRMERPPAASSSVSLSSVPADPSSLIDYWNANIFHPRGIDVVLAKGPRRLSGDRNLPPPDYETPSPNLSSISPSPVSSTRPIVPYGASVNSPPSAPVQACPGQRASPVISCRGRPKCGRGCGRSCRRTRSVSSSSSSSDSGDEDGNVNRDPTLNANRNDTFAASATGPIPTHMPIPVPHDVDEGSNTSNRSVPSHPSSIPNLDAPLPALPSEHGATEIPYADLPPRAQRKLQRLQKRQARQERKGERIDQRLARKYAKLEQKLEKKGLYLSPLLPVDLAMHGVGMGLGLGMRGVGMGLGMGVRGIGMGLRGVTIGIMGGKAPMGEAALADEEDGYYRLIVTDMSCHS